MPAKRVRDFAQEWGVDVKQVLEAAKRAGFADKKAASALGDAEASRIAEELGLNAPRASTVGDERVVTDSSGNTRVERRVRPDAILRRPAAATSSSTGAAAATTSQTLESTGPMVVSPLSSPEPLPDALEPLPALDSGLLGGEVDLPSPVAESFPVAPVTAEAKAPQPSPVEHPAESVPQKVEAEAIREPVAPPEPAVEEKPAEPLAESAAPANAARPEPGAAAVASAASEEPERPSRVLGKIDLSALRGGATAGARATRGTRPAGPVSAPTPFAPAAPLPPVADRGRRRPKRQVFEKADLAESPETDRKRSRIAKKKKPAPGTEIRKTEITLPREAKRTLQLHGPITVQELARKMSVRVSELVAKLMNLGVVAKAPDTIDVDTATLAADEFGFIIENKVVDVQQELEREAALQPDRPEDLQPRPPVVTVMGHVDHGKTSLLDAIRKTNVTAREAGGITQHIGAYSVNVGDAKITFLDTPGHEAFTAMRARGAKVTDIVVLVVAADDGVMPQTKEAIDHARAAGVPIVVAITKIDKPEANIERVKSQLAAENLTPEDWGGDTPVVPVSAKEGKGIDELLEMILLQAEILELKANPNKPARGAIVEAKLDRGRGPVATVLVKEGTLKVGDPVVCGPHSGRVRAMIDDRGMRVKEAGPSMPVEILGLDGVPQAGAWLTVVRDDERARQLAEYFKEKEREESRAKPAKVTLEDLHRRAAAGEVRELSVVLKADVQGSVEALSEALSRLSTPEVSLKIIHAAVGGITESDVMLASASNAVVIGFNVRPESQASAAAEREGVEIRLYNVIYDVIQDVRDAMEGLLEPEKVEKRLGRAEVREVFRIPGVGVVAGCFVSEGKIPRNAQARLIRDHVVVYTGRIASLRRFKEDVREVASGYECGIGLENFQDIKVGDVIEAFEIQEVAARLSAAPRSASAAHAASTAERRA